MKKLSYQKKTPRKIPNNIQLPSISDIRWFRKRLISWFNLNKRYFPWRTSKNSYEIIIAELFLQQTNANKVAQILPVFLDKYPSWESIINGSRRDIESIITPLGLFRRRCVTLYSLAQTIISDPVIPNTRDKLEELSGIGQYIASVILVTVHGKRAPFLDVNMSRVIERFFGNRQLADIRYDPYLQTLSRKIVNVKDCLSANWMILDFASLVCSKRLPKHDQCPLNERCKSAQF